MAGRNKRASLRFFRALAVELAVERADSEFEPPPRPETWEEPPEEVGPLEALERQAHNRQDLFSSQFHYRLEGKKVVRCGFLEWATTIENDADRRVAGTVLADGVFVSTVFLGIDHSFGRAGPPILFETMVFYPPPHGPKELWLGLVPGGGRRGSRRSKKEVRTSRLSNMESGPQYRYATYEEAEEGHARIVSLLEKHLERVSCPGRVTTSASPATTSFIPDANPSC